MALGVSDSPMLTSGLCKVKARKEKGLVQGDKGVSGVAGSCAKYAIAQPKRRHWELMATPRSHCREFLSLASVTGVVVA